MRLVRTSILLFLAAEWLAAFGAAPSFDWAYYRGSIGNDLPILLQVGAEEGKLTGGYFYESAGAPIDLQGTVDEAGAFHIGEKVDEKDTGNFDGAFKEERKRMEGEWASADGKRKLPFALTRFAVQRVSTKTEPVQGQSIESSQAIPIFEDPAATKLNEAIASHLERMYKAFVAEIGKAADPSFQAENTYDLDADIIAYSPGSFVSLVFTTSAYTGGAHGMTQFDTLNLRLTDTGAPSVIGFSDLFVSEQAAVRAISNFCIEDLKRQKAGFVIDGMVERLDGDSLVHFTLSKRGITFLFEPYAVAPYAEGTFEVTVPVDVVKTLLKPGALAGIVN